MKPDFETEVVVVGSGPGGSAAAFYAADKGKKVILVERDARLGGVCLTQGCIPSKALLTATKPIRELEESKARGVAYGSPKVELDKLRAWKESVIDRLAGGLKQLAKMRGVEVLSGRGYFEDSKTLRVETSEGQKYVRFQKAIVAVGSKPAMPKAFDLGSKRVMTSTEALDLEETPETLLVVGGGYIGMELSTVYAALGSKVVVVEAMGSILAGADPDLAVHVMKYAKSHFQDVRLGAKVTSMSTRQNKIRVMMQIDGKDREELYDRVLVAVGRAPNCKDLGLENTKVQLDDKGFIQVNERMETSDPGIYAIGDAAGGVLLAHKASKEARIAVEAMTGEAASSRNVVIPAVVFTDPEVAWCGLTETEAKERNIPVEVAKFPWPASGRAITMDRTDGVTKLILQPGTERVLGVGIAGHGAGELISEGVLAVEMGATARDIAESVHPHPTLSETVMEAAELYYGVATHAMGRKKAEASAR